MASANNDVHKDYDKIAEWFDTHRSRELFEKPYLEKVASLLMPTAKILDVGCGMGEPISEFFIHKGFQLTGVDGSKKLIDLAATRFPEAQFFVQDMRTINFNEKFDCIIVWHALFHLNINDQQTMFKRFKEHITSGGLLVFTTGDRAGEEWSNNGGVHLYHASLSIEDYKKVLAKNKFKIITYKVKDAQCGDATVWISKYEG